MCYRSKLILASLFMTTKMRRHDVEYFATKKIHICNYGSWVRKKGVIHMWYQGISLHAPSWYNSSDRLLAGPSDA